jgi:hypothetical protein
MGRTDIPLSTQSAILRRAPHPDRSAATRRVYDSKFHDSKFRDRKFRRRAVAWGLWLALLPGWLAAADEKAATDIRWYQVELIVFSRLDPGAGQGEQWPASTGFQFPANVIELARPGTRAGAALVAPNLGKLGVREVPRPASGTGESTALPGYEMVASQGYQLRKAADSLRQSGQYQPLLHVAWRQPTVDRPQAQAVLLYEGMTEGASRATKESLAVARLVGTVTLSVSRYLHLEADLVYRPPTTASPPADATAPLQELPGYRLQESRRMRSGEVHYLDHPLFGVVALVTPVETAPAKPAAPAPKPQP